MNLPHEQNRKNQVERQKQNEENLNDKFCSKRKNDWQFVSNFHFTIPQATIPGGSASSKRVCWEISLTTRFGWGTSWNSKTGLSAAV